MEVCDVCGLDHVTERCPELGSSFPGLTRAHLTMPHYAQFFSYISGQIAVLAKQTIPARTRMGPFEAKRSLEEPSSVSTFPLKIFTKDGGTIHLDTHDEDECNWLALVQPAQSPEQHNCMALQISSDIYYTTLRDIQVGEELLVWYAPYYAQKLGMPIKPGAEHTAEPMEVEVKTEPYLQPETGPDPIPASPEKVTWLEPADQVKLVIHEAVDLLPEPRQIRIKHLANKGEYQCTRCEEKFSDLQLLARHVQDHLKANRTPKTKTGNQSVKRKKIVKEKPAVDGEQVIGQISPVEKESSVDCQIESASKKSVVKTGIKQDVKINSKTLHVELEKVVIPKETKGATVNKSSNVSPSKETRDVISTKTGRSEQPEHCEEETTSDDLDKDIRRSSRVPAKKFTVAEVCGLRVGQATAEPETPRRKRGRPRKNPQVSESGTPTGKRPRNNPEVPKSATFPRKRGRPRKDTEVQKEKPVTQNGDNEESYCDATAALSEEGMDTQEAGDGKEEAPGEIDSTQEEDKTSDSSVMCQASDEGASLEESIKSEEKKDDVDEAEEDGNEDPGELKCGECGKEFEKKIFLKKHMECHSGGFVCGYCSRVFNRMQTLKKHKCAAKEQLGADETFTCEFCGAMFNCQKYLHRHMAVHTEEFSCLKCQKVYARKQSLLSHLSTCDPGQIESRGLKGFVCVVCKRSFTKELSLRNHMVLHSGKNMCKTCGKSFTSPLTMTRHKCGGVRVVPSSNLHFCDICPKAYATEKRLERHMAKHTGSLSCPLCHKNYVLLDSLKKHIPECQANSQADESGMVKCTVCDEQVAVGRAFREHFQQHTHPLHCQKCGRGFIRAANLHSHTCKPEEHAVFCPICQKEFQQMRLLKNHMVTHEEKKLLCEFCDKKFRTEVHFNKHRCINPDGNVAFISRLPDGTVRFYEGAKHICQICGKDFSSVSNLNKHITCHGEKLLACDICDKKFHLSVEVKLHKKMVHTTVRRYECKYCHKFMKSKNSLYQHTQTFHKDGPKFFACKECGKKFNLKGNLKKHMLFHSDKKQYSCENCGKEFKYPEQRRRHELWHLHGNRFQCTLCERSFLMEFELKKHINSFHGAVRYNCKYCRTECHHPHTIKRHLRRRHFDIPEWQKDTAAFIKSITKVNIEVLEQSRQANVEETVITGTEAEMELEMDGVVEQEESTQTYVSGLDPAVLENLLNETTPVIVAEVQGVSGQGVTSTQTVIIQPAGDHPNQDHPNFVSEEVAMAIKSLNMQGYVIDGSQDVALEVGQPVTNGQQISDVTYVPVSDSDITYIPVSDSDVTYVPVTTSEQQTHVV